MVQSYLKAPTRTEIPLKIAIHTGNDAFDDLKSEWNTLLRQSESDDIFLTWEWQATWWEVYQPGQLWLLSCRTEDDDLVGIAPWFMGDDKVIRMIGCEDVTDYLDVIVHQEYAHSVYASFAGFLAENRESFQSINLCNIPAGSATHIELARQLEHNGFAASVETVDVCPVINLPGSWDDYLKQLDKKQRHEVRRKLRRAHGSNHKVQTYTVDSSHDLDAEVDRFLKLMESSDEEKSAFLQDERNVTFFRRLAPLALANGWLHLTFLLVDDNPAAAYFSFEYRNRLLVYNSGFALDEYGNISPGVVLMAHAIHEAIERGNDAFDLLRGDEPYKYRMGGVDTYIYRLKATHEA